MSASWGLPGAMLTASLFSRHFCPTATRQDTLGADDRINRLFYDITAHSKPQVEKQFAGLHIALVNGRIAVKTVAGYIHDFVRKFFGVGFLLGSRCGSLAVGASPVDAYTDGGRGDGP